MANISAGRFNRWIQKLFYLQTGGPASVYTVDTAIQPVVAVLNGVEERYLQGWNRFAITAQITGAAGSLAALEIRNPTGSSLVAVLERIGFRSNSATGAGLVTYSAAGVASDLTTQVFAVRLDGRIQPGSGMILSTSTNATGLSSIINISAASVGETQLIITTNQEIPILPGGGLIILDNLAADTGSFNLMWRERVLETSELT